MALKRLAQPVFCAVIVCAPISPQSRGTGAISGTVVEGESGDGVRKAIVTLTLESDPPQWATARTDGSGHFQFDGLPAGKYTLSATKGTEAKIYGAKNEHELGNVITLADGEIRGGVTLRFVREASIEGRVFDSDGEPLADASVMLLRRGRDLGVPIVVNERGDATDERGEYRFTNINPGRYYIHVSPGGMRFGGTPSTGRIPVDQYYGGARDSKDASPIHISGGEQLSGIDFHLISEPAVHIRGQVLGVREPPESEPQQAPRKAGNGNAPRGPAVEVQISPADGERARATRGTIARGPEYRFDMPGMVAGRYRIVAHLQSGVKTYGASQIVDVHPETADIALTLAPAVDVHGTLRVEGQAGAGSLHVRLRGAGNVGNVVTAEPGRDGRFTLAQVTPGEWNVEVDPLPPGFLKAVRFSDKDVRFATFEVGADSDAALNIVVSMSTASIDGEIDAGASDAVRAGVVVARADQYHTFTRFYYTAEADSDGKFHLKGIAPGKYKVFALERMKADAFRDPEAVDQLDELGETVDLREGATGKAHPKLIPMERAEKALQ